ncbi:protein of unknown function [Candidatus Methylocalor cossyra]|uniref:Uncharacterized protein n=1 Tax=Candidatus Methylocalor cossyra TaxID=3108543 RepID=A0ABM9NKQ0_9GAMM
MQRTGILYRTARQALSDKIKRRDGSLKASVWLGIWVIETLPFRIL